MLSILSCGALGSFFLSLKGVRKLTFEIGFLKVSCGLEFVSAVPAAGPFWGYLPHRLFELEVPVSCCYRKCPQGGSTSHTQLSFYLQPEPGLWRGMWMRKHPRASVSLLLPRWSFTFPSPLASCLPGALLPDEVPRRLHSQEGVLSWGPPAPGDLGSGWFSMFLQVRGSGH